MPRPNVLLLFTDQQRFDAMACAGNAELQTPNLDALAASGVRFSHACTPTPICVAARMTLAFGHRMSRHRWVDNNKLPGPTPELPSVMTLLHDAGYVTHCVGKTHFRGRHYGFHRVETCEEIVQSVLEDDYVRYLWENRVRTRYQNGLRELLYFQPQTNGIPVEHHKSTWVTNRSLAFLRDHARYNGRRPFFLMASWTAPHPPFAPCEPYDTLYDPDQMGLPVHTERPIRTLPAPAWAHRGRLDGAHRDPDRLRRLRALYYGMVTHVDQGIGEILDELDVLGLAEDTVVIFASDHGDMLGDHGLSQKNVPYEHSVRIPLLLRWPGRTQAGRVSSHLVGLTDVLPTLIHGIGLEYPVSYGPLPGESLVGSPGGGLATERHAYVMDFGHGSGRWVAMRTSTLKYVYWFSGGHQELYDLVSDPWETRNLVNDEPELAAEFRWRVMAWERLHGFPDSFDGDDLCSYKEPAPPPEDYRVVRMGDNRWADNLPVDEQSRVESFAECFSRAISRETCLEPDKLSIDLYKEQGGQSLVGTPWEDAWQSV